MSNKCGLSDFESLFFNEEVDRRHYDISSHYITTKDNFKLMMFHVRLTPIQQLKLPKSLQNNYKKKLLLIHEFAGSSDSWFYNGKNSMGFFLLSQGFDVWVANNRGNKYSSESLKDIPKEIFYDYSFAEMGEYDIPAMYRYILDTQGYAKGTKITPIGYSQGTSQMFSGLLENETGDY